MATFSSSQVLDLLHALADRALDLADGGLSVSQVHDETIVTVKQQEKEAAYERFQQDIDELQTKLATAWAGIDERDVSIVKLNLKVADLTQQRDNMIRMVREKDEIITEKCLEIQRLEHVVRGYVESFT